MPRRDVAAGGRDGKRRLDACDGEPCAEWQRLEWRQFDRGAGKHERTQRRDLVRGGGPPRAQRAPPQKTPIAPGPALVPPPTLPRLLHHDAPPPLRPP